MWDTIGSICEFYEPESLQLQRKRRTPKMRALRLLTLPLFIALFIVVGIPFAILLYIVLIPIQVYRHIKYGEDILP